MRTSCSPPPPLGTSVSNKCGSPGNSQNNRPPRTYAGLAPRHLHSTTARVRNIDGPIARAVVFSRLVRGFQSRELLLLGSLHVELSSGHRWNHPPLQQPAPPPVPADRVEVSSVFYPHPPPRPPKRKHVVKPHTPVAVRAATCTRADRREAPPGIQRDQWEAPPIHWRQRGSNRLLQGWRRVRCHSCSGCHRYIMPLPR